MESFILDKYYIGLKAYLTEPNEENLYQAFLLSSDLVEHEVGPDEMVEIHSQTLAKILQGESALMMMNYTMQSFTFLLEIMITYGLIHKTYLDNRDAQIAQLKAYVEQIEELNQDLDHKVTQGKILAATANSLTFENSSISRAFQQILTILEEYLPQCMLFYIDNHQGQGKVFTNNKEEDMSPEAMDTVSSLLDTGNQDIVTRQVSEEVEVLLPIGSNGLDVIIGLQSSEKLKYFSSDFWITLRDLFQSFLEKMGFIKDLTVQSIEDCMTGLYNFRFFEESLRKMVNIKKRSGKSFCLMLIDVDNFKDINDQHGHIAGDQVLKTLAHTIKECCRASDTLCRYGGDEFVIILPDTSAQQALQLGKRINCIIKNRRFENKQLTVSIGIAEYDGDDSPLDFVHRTDKALYQAKQLGKNLVIIAS